MFVVDDEGLNKDLQAFADFFGGIMKGDDSKMIKATRNMTPEMQDVYREVQRMSPEELAAEADKPMDSQLTERLRQMV